MFIDKNMPLALIILTLLLGCNEVAIKEESTQVIKNNAITAKASSEHKDLLHVPSPEWQDQIIYFLMIDRFSDGNLENSDQGVGVYELGAKDKYNGGDLQGVINKLDYIQQLGATAVWTTPHVANQWWDPIAEFWGYHGYWARDFKKVDEHYGQLEDYQNLSRNLHGKGMYLIQDVVVNHTGNFFYYDGEYDPNDVTKNFTLNTESLPSKTASQFPLNLNNVNNTEHKLSNVFNWTPSIQDVSVSVQENTYQTSGLDDLNTRNPIVRDVLKGSFGFWIKETGVDAFRVDTAKYVENEFYEDFLHSDNGIVNIAKSTGRDNFLTFGEIFETSKTNDDYAEKKISTYLGTAENPRMDSPIGFPLYNDIKTVFAGGRPTANLSYRVKAAMQWYKDPYTAVNFIDNHDVERFLANGTLAGFKQAYAFLMSVPGIPAIYQGDEQSHILSRQAMFAGGFASEQDQFNQQSEMYLYIQKLTNIRLKNKVFSRGTIDFIQDNTFGPGILAYKRVYKDQTAYIIINSDDKKALLSDMPTSFSGDNKATVLLSERIDSDLPFASDGSLTMVMPARSSLIFMGVNKAVSTVTKKVQEIQVNPIAAEFNNIPSTMLSGTTITPYAKLLSVIDGNLEQAKAFSSDSQGNWSVELELKGLGSHEHSIEIFMPEKNVVSKKHSYVVNSDLVSAVAAVEDKIGDDKGLSGTYIKPGYQEDGCYLDIKSATAKAGGGNMELVLTLCDISTAWSPSNGFDHLAFTIYFDKNDKQGNKALPLLKTDMPHDGHWNFAHSAFGWGSYIFTTEKASATKEGVIINYTPEIEVNLEAKQIRIIYEGTRLGVGDWRNHSIYITTWDKDEGGDYRRIEALPAKWHFSNKDVNAPLIADAAYLTLKPTK